MIAPARVDQLHSECRQRDLADGRVVLIQATNETNLACAFAHENRGGKERLRKAPEGPLHVRLRADGQRRMFVIAAPQKHELLGGDLPEDHGRMRRQKALKRRSLLFGAE